MKEKFAKVVSKVRWYFLKRKWIKALRSGDYPQAKGWLRTEKGFCCLGVLCDISKRGTWTDDFCYELPGGSKESALAFLAVPELSQVTQGDLSRMNDKGMTFAQIAAYIKENL